MQNNSILFWFDNSTPFDFKILNGLHIVHAPTTKLRLFINRCIKIYLLHVRIKNDEQKLIRYLLLLNVYEVVNLNPTVVFKLYAAK